MLQVIYGQDTSGCPGDNACPIPEDLEHLLETIKEPPSQICYDIRRDLKDDKVCENVIRILDEEGDINQTFCNLRP